MNPTDESSNTKPSYDLPVHSWEIEELAQRCGHRSPDLQLALMCGILLFLSIAYYFSV